MISQVVTLLTPDIGTPDNGPSDKCPYISEELNIFGRIFGGTLKNLKKHAFKLKKGHDCIIQAVLQLKYTGCFVGVK